MTATPDPCAACGSIDDLELVTMQVKGVDSWVEVVDNNVNNVTVLDDEGQDGAIDIRVCVCIADSSRSIQGRCFLANVRLIVEAKAANYNLAFMIAQRMGSKCSPRNAIYVFA
jgi:hypothetical protein